MAGQQRRGGAGIGGGGQGGRAGKPGSHRKGAPAGSGGRRRKGLEGRGATPPAEMRKGHPAQRRANAAAARRPAGGATRPERSERPARRGAPEAPELVAGRNPVIEALRAKVPAITLYIATGLDADERVREARAVATKRGLPVADVSRLELDRLVDGAQHQGLALAVPAYRYSHPDDLLARATDRGTPLLVALDGVTDPRNLGAVVRSAAAFGAHGVVIPERRAAGMTATAWKTSAGAAARLPVARATNLTRTLRAYGEAGLMSVGLAADGEISIDELEASVDPLVLVVGSEGRGLSRLVGEQCDLRVRIPMAGPVESLNAGVAAGVALAEIARRRRG